MNSNHIKNLDRVLTINSPETGKKVVGVFQSERGYSSQYFGTRAFMTLVNQYNAFKSLYYVMGEDVFLRIAGIEEHPVDEFAHTVSYSVEINLQKLRDLPCEGAHLGEFESNNSKQLSELLDKDVVGETLYKLWQEVGFEIEK